MKDSKERNEIIAAKALHWMIRNGEAEPKKYHIPGEDGRAGYDVTIYKLKPPKKRRDDEY